MLMLPQASGKTSARPAEQGVFTVRTMKTKDPATRRAALITPDGRYIVVRGRLWRTANPSLDPAERQGLVDKLMKARRAVAAARRAADTEAEQKAHAAVDEVKRMLGERGPVWWDDGAPDLNRHMARTTMYAEWFARQA